MERRIKIRLQNTTAQRLSKRACEAPREWPIGIFGRKKSRCAGSGLAGGF